MNPEEPVPSPARVEGLDAARVMARALLTPPSWTATWEPMEPAALNTLLPGYEVIELIGRGGMGAVYRTRQKSLDRPVAIKLLPLEASLDTTFATRFQNEARLLARLQHKHIVAVHDTGTTTEGHLYLVMELIEGTDLGTLIRGQSLPPDKAVEYLVQVCEGLQYAHQCGIIHRDIKPSNILIGNDQVVRVADFGLAKVRPEADSVLTSPTLTGTVMGTPDYMAPEQRLGHAVDHRADIYSLGVLIYEMLTGHVPRGSWEPPSKVTGVDTRLDALVTQAMQNDPTKRQQSVEEILQVLRAVQSQTGMPLWTRILNTKLPNIGPLGSWLFLILLAPTIIATLPVAWKQRNRPSTENSALANVYEQRPVLTNPLADLILPTAVKRGDWQMETTPDGGVLTIKPGTPELSSYVTLPVEGPRRAYTASLEINLASPQCDGGLIFPAGTAQTGLVIHLQRITGIGFIGGQAWNLNPTARTISLQTGGWNRIDLRVKPAGERVAITVRLNGATIIEWEGPQSDLTLYRDPNQGWRVEGEHTFGLASYSGNVSFRNVRITWLD